MTLMGKSLGYAISECSGGIGGGVVTMSLSQYLVVGGAQGRIDGAWFAGSDRVSVVVHDRQYFFGGRRQKNFVGLGDLGLWNAARLEGNAGLGRQLFQEPIAYAFKNEIVQRRRQQHAVAHDPDVAGSAFGQEAIAKLQNFVDAGFDGLLLGQHIAQQRNRLDLAAQPADVGRRYGGQAL